MMVMVKADDDHDNDEGGFGIGRVVRISQVYQLRICLGRIPIQPPYHILSFHPTTQDKVFFKSSFCFTLPKLVFIFTLISLQPTNLVIPGNYIIVSEIDFECIVSRQANPQLVSQREVVFIVSFLSVTQSMYQKNTELCAKYPLDLELQILREALKNKLFFRNNS